MDLVFMHDPRGETFTRITRGDGVVLGLPSYSRKYRVPHDLAHAAVERSLELSGGIFGCIEAGGVFDNMTVLQGKPRHDARARSQRILKAASGSIAVAESGRRAASRGGTSPATALRRCAGGLGSDSGGTVSLR
ncbi:hypothetical protein [Amycolatopsis sp. NPDC051372]|uniref:hypothetical protein n=1 Tax=unclassified Amycolatopsis TaxID=2618356 RepID=UPI003439DF3C